MSKAIAFIGLCITLVIIPVHHISAGYGDVDIPPRPPDAPSGSEFMASITDLGFADREDAIVQELLAGNIPGFMRNLVEIEETFNDADGNSHQVTYWVMPDYLAIGSDSNYCRVPMGPITAQHAADAFGTTMPTRKLVDNIYQHAAIKLEPKTYVPVGNQNEQVEKFIEHNSDIQAQFNAAGGALGQLVGGIKKDVVLSNKITDPSRPNHVVIYGWHWLNGTPIQPLTNIHINTYVDYSHGIRFLDSDIIIDGDSTTVQAILQDDTLYKILSDESGPMPVTSYIFNTNKPASFGVTSEYDGQIKCVVAPDANVDSYALHLSQDGEDFGDGIPFTGGEYVLEGLPSDSVMYVKLTSENSSGTSPFSEMLAVLPKSTDRGRILVVNGFDRGSDGNTYDFIRQHAAAVAQGNFAFASATNEAVTDGLVSLTDYPVVDYILGEESTADETFSGAEQILIAEYLEQGGRLFVSGSEIAWDLDYRGSTSDKTFFKTYLKARYSADAPGAVSGQHYAATGVSGGIFEDITAITFDNGTHGTYNVEWADALIPQGGAVEAIHYQNVTAHKVGGIQYEGLLGDGDTPGKLVYLGFPFETIYPDSTRNIIMENTLQFLSSAASASEPSVNTVPEEIVLAQNFPNPFNAETVVQYSLPVDADVLLIIYDTTGRHIKTLVNSRKNTGYHSVTWDATNDVGQRVSSGVYLYRISTGTYSQTRRLVVLQ